MLTITIHDTEYKYYPKTNIMYINERDTYMVHTLATNKNNKLYKNTEFIILITHLIKESIIII